MRVKPNDQSYTISDIQFDSPEPTDRYQIEEIIEKPEVKTPKNEKIS